MREKTWEREEREEREMITRKKFCGRLRRKWEDERENEENSEMMEWRLRLEGTGERLPKKWERERENIEMKKLKENKKHEKLQRGEGDNKREKSGREGEKEVQKKMEDRKKGISDSKKEREIGKDVGTEEKERTREWVRGRSIARKKLEKERALD